MDSAPHRLAPWPKGRPPFTAEEVELALAHCPAWRHTDARLARSVKTADFATALALANRVGQLADLADHHPDLLVRWGELRITLWTHSAGGLTELDFTLARWIDACLESAAARG